MLRSNGRGYAGEVNIIHQGLKSTMTILVLLCLLILSILSTGFISARQIVRVADGQKVELSAQA
ncbi:MAG: hypothetical protein MJ157_04595, partial [Clostridia bacterium]|nr:hypothetical protein [Clostridia bacterium]